MSNDYISNNPNVRLNILRKVSKDYEGYIAGIGGNNSLYTFSPDKELKSLLQPGEEEKTRNEESENEKQQRLIEKTLNVILDSSNGAYLTKDYLSTNSIFNSVNISKFNSTNSTNPEAKLLGQSLKVLTQPGLIDSIQNGPLPLVPGAGISATSSNGFESYSNTNQLIFTETEASKNKSEETEEEKQANEKSAKIENFKSKYTAAKFSSLKPEEKKSWAESLEIKENDLLVILQKNDAEKKQNQTAKNNLIQNRKDAVKNNNKSLRKDNSYVADIADFLKESPGRTADEVDVNGRLISKGNVSLNSLPINNKKEGDFSINSYVFCNQNIQRSNRQKDFLNLFLNGIPPIEMSRCTPFLDITIYHKNSSKNNKRYLNHEYHMRFIKEENGSFVLSKNTLSDATRINNSPREDDKDASFMSVFTSPQTMANANINKGMSPDNIFANFNSSNKESLSDQKFLEPIVPMMTLTNFQVAIDGMGFGMVSSRKGSMSLVLHDRSRLKDFAPLVSLNQIVDTSIRVEFGWSHPEGNPTTSKNEIGKFLNATRDVQFYNLMGSNLDFQNNAVNIQIQLASSGFELTKSVSAGAGYYSPLSFISEKMNKIINDIIEKESKSNESLDLKKQESVLKQMKIIRTAITSQTAVVLSSDYKKLLASFKSDNKTNLDILKQALTLLGYLKNDNKDVSTAGEIIKLLDENKVKLENTSKERSMYTSKLIKDKIAIARMTEDFDLLETTNTDFQKKYNVSGQRSQDEKLVFDGLGDMRFKETISLGKLVLLYCGLPMLSTCEFEDVQVFFYPINNRAGGARRFTTASLPIEYSIVRNAIDEKFKNEGNISVKGMFAFLSNLFEDTGLQTYGVEKFDFEALKSAKTPADIAAEKEEAVKNWKSDPANGQVLTPNEEAQPEGTAVKELSDEEKEAIYRKDQKNKFLKKIPDNINKLYAYDGLPAADPSRLVLPDLKMHMEVLPVIDPKASTTNSSSIEDFLLGAIRTIDKSNGYKSDKKILRIHVYDGRANSSAKGELLNNILNDSVADAYVGKIPEDIKTNIIKVDPDLKTAASKIVSKIPTSELKYYVKRSYPNVTWGANSSVVKSLRVTSNTHDKVSKLIMIRRKRDERSGGASKNRVSPEEEVSINPSPVNLTIFGCPFIDRGTQIFLDTGTGTNVDNVYTVNSITHTVKSGDYTTTLSLALTAQGAITATRKKLANKLKVAAKEIEKNTTSSS